MYYIYSLVGAYFDEIFISLSVQFCVILCFIIRMLIMNE